MAAGLGATQPLAGAASAAVIERPILLIHMQLPQALGADELMRLRKGLQVRAGLPRVEDVRLTVVAGKAKKAARDKGLPK